MVNFFYLCLNENLKLYKKKSTAIFMVLILLSIFISIVVIYNVKNSNIKTENIAKQNSSAIMLLDSANTSLQSMQNGNKNVGMLGIPGIASTSSTLGLLKANSECYQYAVDNNIILDYASENKYYKSDILYELITLKTKLYDLEESKVTSIDKTNELSKDIKELTQILEDDDFSKYIEIKISRIENSYKNNEISKTEKELSIYIENLNKKYEVGRYNSVYTIWKNKSMENIKVAKQSLLEDKGILSTDEKNKLNETIILEIYNLESNTPVNDGFTNLTNYYDGYMNLVETISIPLLAIFMIIIAGSIISDEFSKGTVKQILMTPNKRWKVLLSKILVLAFNLIIFTIVLSLATKVLGNVFFNEYSKSKYAYFLNGNIIEMNNIKYIIFKFLSYDISILVYILFSIMISTITTSTSISVGTAMFLYAGNITFMSVINKQINSVWVKFIPFNNLNITNKIFTNSNPLISNIFEYKKNIFVNSITLNFSIGVILVCSFLLLITTLDSFNKKQI